MKRKWKFVFRKLKDFYRRGAKCIVLRPSFDGNRAAFLMYNGLLCIFVSLVTSFAIFSLVIEGSNIQGSRIEYVTITLSFVITIFGISTLVSSSAVCLVSRQVSLKTLYGDLHKVFYFIALIEMILFIVGIHESMQIKKLTSNIVEWSLFIQYYQEEQVRVDLDMMQKELKCCGFVGYQDWDLNPYYSCKSTGYTRCSVPISCCKLKNPDSTCVLGIRNPENNETKLKESIYLDGCLKNSQIWYQCTMNLLNFSTLLMILLQVFLLRISVPAASGTTKRKENQGDRQLETKYRNLPNQIPVLIKLVDVETSV